MIYSVILFDFFFIFYIKRIFHGRLNRFSLISRTRHNVFMILLALLSRHEMCVPLRWEGLNRVEPSSPASNYLRQMAERCRVPSTSWINPYVTWRMFPSIRNYKFDKHPSRHLIEIGWFSLIHCLFYNC